MLVEIIVQNHTHKKINVDISYMIGNCPYIMEISEHFQCFFREIEYCH